MCIAFESYKYLLIVGSFDLRLLRPGEGFREFGCSPIQGQIAAHFRGCSCPQKRDCQRLAISPDTAPGSLASLRVRAAAARYARPVPRYADDFVVLHPTEQGVLKAKSVLETWIKDIGLEMKPSKTRITHTLQEYQGHVGFDFLGWTVRQFPVGKRTREKSIIMVKSSVSRLSSNQAKKQKNATQRKWEKSSSKIVMHHRDNSSET